MQASQHNGKNVVASFMRQIHIDLQVPQGCTRHRLKLVTQKFTNHQKMYKLKNKQMDFAFYLLAFSIHSFSRESTNIIRVIGDPTLFRLHFYLSEKRLFQPTPPPSPNGDFLSIQRPLIRMRMLGRSISISPALVALT